MDDDSTLTPPDLVRGVPLEDLPEGGILAGQVGGEPVFIWFDGETVRAYGSKCPHLGAPLQEGLVEGHVLHCPWHHACFDMLTGDCLSAPAFDPLPRFTAIVADGRIRVASSVAHAMSPPRRPSTIARQMVVVGGGAAGFAAADGLRRGGFQGDITLISDEATEPYDRTLLTKDYLDGSFGRDRLRLARHGLTDLDVRLELGVPAERIDRADKRVVLGGGHAIAYDKLLLATGAEPVRPDVPGIDLPHVHVLRCLADCDRLVAAAKLATRIAVLGGSFIAMEAAASLRSRGANVAIIAPEGRPLEKVLGRALSDLIVGIHRAHGVELHLGRKAIRITEGDILLDDGAKIAADLMLVGAGVTPRIALAKSAQLAVDKGVLVDSHLRSSDPDIFAAGDIACWPDPHSGKTIRVEHWLVAERQGQTVAVNMLGADESFDMVPFFWTKHFDLGIRYVGHAEQWDEVAIEGDVSARNAAVHFRRQGRDLAMATVGRDLQCLQVERAMQDGCRGAAAAASDPTSARR